MSISTVEQDGSGDIPALHSDVIRAHILTRLDGPTLASAASACSELHRLSREPSMWSDICATTWPSTNTPHVRNAIASFPGAHRALFSDAYPLLLAGSERHRRGPEGAAKMTMMISAVDIRYRGEPILSKVVETDAASDWFDHSPFMVDLLHRRKDAVATDIPFREDAAMCVDLAEGLELSWIVIDPAANRAANLSSFRPVSVQRHVLAGDVRVRFVTVLASGEQQRGSSSELVQFEVSVTCGGSHTGTMHVREVCLVAEDMDGTRLTGRDSLVILRRALRGKRGKGVGREVEAMKRYVEFVERKRKRKQRIAQNENVLDFLSIFFFSALAIFTLFWVTFGRSYYSIH